MKGRSGSRTEAMDKKEFVLKAVADKKDLIVEVSDKIFDYAETGFHEFKTAKLYEDVLKKEGFQVERGVGGMPTAFKATYGTEKPVIGFLAEYDALPELSQEGGCTMRKKAEGENPDGHGCGHNLLGAGAMAAALAVKAYLEEHAAAAPELGRSALDAAELMSVGVNYLREHIISDARIHYAYRDVGGIAPNVVQGHSRVHYFIRAPKSWQVKEIYRRVVDVAEGAAKMTGTEMTYELYAGLSDYIPNHVLSEVLHESMEEIGAPAYDEADFALASRFFHETATPEELEAKRASLRKLFGADHLDEIEARPLHTQISPLVWTGKVQAGSTDVGDASYVIPTAMCTTATATLGTAAHTWQMTAHGNTEIAHKAMLNAGEAIALAALKTMESPEILKKAHDEWLAETNGIYECPIPKEIGPRLED